MLLVKAGICGKTDLNRTPEADIVRRSPQAKTHLR